MLMVTRRSSPRGSRGSNIWHLSKDAEHKPACGASTTTAASVIPMTFDTVREARAKVTCSRCWTRMEGM